MPDGLPTALFIDAHLRRLDQAGISYYVIRKGAYASGTVLVKINALQDGCVMYQQQRDIYGELGWMAALKQQPVKEVDADAFIHRAIDRDPDLWVIEVEDRKMRNPFEGKVF